MIQPTSGLSAPHVTMPAMRRKAIVRSADDVIPLAGGDAAQNTEAPLLRGDRGVV
jgi:hypothetical protein